MKNIVKPLNTIINEEKKGTTRKKEEEGERERVREVNWSVTLEKEV